jgi:hypothetical protein
VRGASELGVTSCIRKQERKSDNKAGISPSIPIRYNVLTCYLPQEGLYVGQHLLGGILDVGLPFEVAKLHVVGRKFWPWIIERLGVGSARWLPPLMIKGPRGFGLHEEELVLPIVNRAGPTSDLLGEGRESGPEVIPTGGGTGRDYLKNFVKESNRREDLLNTADMEKTRDKTVRVG